ncbi:MAG TPA: SdrD B-like domain-containing protein, partial [Chitinophagaceae bacterium]|nr:SdrD B-like domain-containing protein [Chitinophagaceae bacterium]
MITTIRRLCIILVSFSFFLTSKAQDLKAINQNSSGSNNAQALSISFSPAYSTSVNNSKDSLLFRGSGGGFRVGADYFFGRAGIGFSSGFGSSSPDNASINDFLKNTSIPPDQLLINKASQQNMYLLLGPSVRFGNAVQLYAHAKGGLFINNGGLISIQQRGAARAAYRNESTGKSIYPGFQTGLSFQYKGKSDVWSFGIGADYMSTKTEVTNYDARRGGGIEGLKLSQNIQDIVAGVSIRYNIFSPRDHSSGQSTGRRVLPTVNKREINSSRDVSTGQSTGKRSRETGSGLSTGKTYQPGKPVYGNIVDKEENDGNCGPVTQKITNADGTTEEITFACPADAASYNNKVLSDGGMPNRISMNVTTPKQTQGSTFGEKTFAAPHVFEKKGIISGRLAWTTSNTTGIVTNAVITNSSPRSGSTTMNSQNSATRTTNQSSFGTLVRLSAREAGSGMATGKRSREAGSGMATGKRSREAGSGLSTGRRQYEPVFIENVNDVCNPCMAEAKLSSVKNNPLYQENKRTAGTDDDCDGIAGIDVYLLDINGEVVVSKTITEACGDFFFANVPEGNYVVKVSGGFISRKGYDVYLKSKTDLAGDVSQSSDGLQLLINTSDNNEGTMQKAGISTSRSNLRTKSVSIIEADLDGDGEFESLKATGIFSDGSSRDLTNDVSLKKVNKVDAFSIKQSAMQMSSGTGAAATHITGITVAKGDVDGDGKAERINTSHSNIKNLRATATFSDGSTQDVTEGLVVNTSHSNVKQYNIVVADLDGDGFAEAIVKTKTKSNQTNDRMAVSGEDNNDGIWSPRSNIKMMSVATGDVDGDGAADIAAGNLSGATLKNYFETGDKPTQEQRIVGGLMPGGAILSSAMRPGNPIGGLTIKGGKNPGGNLHTVQTNENGEFEFPDL